MEPIWIFPTLFATGLAAGFVDTIAGGGGLITLPVLMGLGLPPKEALATNKLQSSFGSGSASFHYAKAGVMDLKDCALGILFTFVGTSIGSVAVLHLNTDFLRRLIPLLLTASLMYFLVKPKAGFEATAARMRRVPFYLVFGLALGFYDGFFGPGTGSFWAMAFMIFLGFDLIRATGCTKAMNFPRQPVCAAGFSRGRPRSLLLGRRDGCGTVDRCVARGSSRDSTWRCIRSSHIPLHGWTVDTEADVRRFFGREVRTVRVGERQSLALEFIS